MLMGQKFDFNLQLINTQLSFLVTMKYKCETQLSVNLLHTCVKFILLLSFLETILFSQWVSKKCHLILLGTKILRVRLMRLFVSENVMNIEKQ